VSNEKPWDVMRRTAWANLMSAAHAFSTADNKETRAALSREAMAWAAVNGPQRVATGERSAVAGDGPTVFPPFGRAKGTPIKGAALDNLRFYERCALENLDNPDKAKWHHKEQKLLDAVRDELRRQGQAADYE